MPSPSDPGPGTRHMAKQFKVLLRPSFHKLRISDELAGCFDAGEGGGEGSSPQPTALLVSPLGKVWRVQVGRDGGGAFLGRGWAEFLAAHGVGLGWFVVLRHEGGGVLTFKVFDTSLCIKEFGAPAAVMTCKSSKRVICKPQFIRIFDLYFREKMILPARFVKDYITEECLNSRTAIILSPLGKIWRIDLKTDQSGIFFTGGWSQFLDFHRISNGDVLLLRYEGNMVFKFKAFGVSGCQKDFKNQNAGIQLNTEKQQETPSSIRKRKHKDEKSSSEGNKRPKTSVTSQSLKEPYRIGTSPWIRKKINTYALERLLSCNHGFQTFYGTTALERLLMNCTITLKTTMDSTRSWQVRGAAYKNYRYILGKGWETFCQENRLKTGDLCTFNILDTTLWHVDIKRSTLADSLEQKKSPCSSSRDHNIDNSMPSLRKVQSLTRSFYDIGPPSWIRKEMSTYSIAKRLSLAPEFCSQIGLPKHCSITLKTSINSSNSWQVGGLWQKKGSFVIGRGWQKFRRDNKLKVGDVCTFSVIETELWHVVITHHP